MKDHLPCLTLNNQLIKVLIFTEQSQGVNQKVGDTIVF